MKPLLLLLTISLISSCQTRCLTKEAFITGYDKFSEDVKTHYKDLSEEDWANIDKELKAYVDECYPKYKADLTVSEKVAFWKNTLSYGIYRRDKNDGYELDLDIDYEKEINDLTDQGRAELEKFINKDLKPNLEGAIDDVVREVELLGDRLKEWINSQ